MKGSLFLNYGDGDKIHQASLRVLEEVGVDLNHEEAEELFLEGGASRDKDGRILISREMVEEAIDKAVDEVQLYDREGNKSILLKNGNTYFGPGSDALYNLDLDTLEIRQTKISDVEQNVRIADALGFDFIMSMGLPEDVEGNKLYATVFAKMVSNTTKPLVITSTTLKEVKQIHGIASIAAGGKERLKKKPFFLAYMEPISPLQMDRSGIERMLYCVENDIPILYAAGANSGSGAPVTPEGGVIQGSAESLAGLVLALLKNKEAKFVYGANTSSMDMKKMIVSYGAPEWAKTVAMYAEMGQFYNLPSWGTAGCSDTFYLDAQAAWEAQESILMALLSKTTMAHDVGYLGHGELYDPRMLILTDEMIKRARHLLKPLNLSENATDEIVKVIDDVSREREIYPSHQYTFENFREALWLPPDYIYRGLYRELEDADNFGELLKIKAEEILKSHVIQELSPAKAKEVEDILERS